MNAKETSKFAKKYPFIGPITLQRLEPFDDNNGITYDELTINVKKATGELMFHQADNVGLAGSTSCIFFVDGKRKGQVMKRAEYLFAIDHEDKIINQIDWPRNCEEEKNRG